MAIPPIIPPSETGSNLPPILPPAVSQTNKPSLLKFGVISILALGVGAILIVGLIEHFNPPETSMAALQAAIKRHDRKSVEIYVDAPALTVSMRKFMRDVFELQDKIKAKQNTDESSVDSFLGILVKPIGDKIVSEMIDRIITPENLLDGMSGESVSGIMKKSLTGMSDDVADASMKMAGSKNQVYTPFVKMGLGFCADSLVDAADRERAKQDSETQSIVLTEKDIKITTLFEASDRYVIMYKYKTPNPDFPILAVVFERHGLTVWKYSELRLLPSNADK